MKKRFNVGGWAIFLLVLSRMWACGSRIAARSENDPIVPEGSNIINAISCDTSACHGDATSFHDLSGSVDTSLRSVGAHMNHLQAGTLRLAIPCKECHIVPVDLNSPGHLGSELPAEVAFGNLARTGGVAAGWNGTSCTNTYCHGNFVGGAMASPVWTKVDGTQTTCGSCHSISPPPATGDHQRRQHIDLPCSDCHGTGYSSTGVRLADHINGMRNVGGEGSQIMSWVMRSCTPTCHDTKSW